MKNKIIALLLTVISLPAFAQTKVAQKQIDNLQDSLNVRQRYADTNTTDATRNWVLGQIAADTPTLQEVLTKNNVTNRQYVNTNNANGGSGLRVVKDAIVYKSPGGGSYIGQYIIKHDWLEYIFLAFEISINARTATEARISKLSFQVAHETSSSIAAQEGYILSNDKALNDIIESNVKCAFDQDGKLAIILGTPTTSWGSNTVIQVDVKTYNGTNVGWRSGWTIERTNEDLTSTYTQITSVPLDRMGTRSWVQSQNYLTAETDPVYTAAEPSILRYRSAITSSSNLNSFTSTGIYNGTSAVTATLSNCPFPSGEIQLSVTTSGNYVRQMITNVGSTFTNQIYTRTSVNGGTNWSSWQRLIRGGDSVSLLTNDAGYITQNIANANLSIAGGTNRTLTIGPGSTFSIIGNSMIRMSGGGGNPALELIANNVFISGYNPDSFGVSMRTTNLTTNRDADWQDTSGTVAFLHDIHGGIVDDGSGYGMSEDEYDGWITQGGLSTHLTIVDDDYTVTPGNYTIICRGANTWDLELPDPTDWRGRILMLSMQMKNDGVVGVNLSEDVKYFDPADGIGTMTTSFLKGNGVVYQLQSNGSNWYWLNPKP